jgi:hypothetical protein
MKKNDSSLRKNDGMYYPLRHNDVRNGFFILQSTSLFENVQKKDAKKEKLKQN